MLVEFIRYVVAFVMLLVMALLPSRAMAQAPPASGVIQGTVVSEVGEPLAGVSVAVRSAADSTVVGTSLTNSSGGFRVTGLRPGSYIVEGATLGYASFRRSGVGITASEPSVALGRIPLTSDAIALEELVVTGERPDVIVAPDRTIYNTSDMPIAGGGMATDVLQTVPELEVDIDGTVQLRGTTPQIYLNGRPAPMDGESLQIFLQQFPADRIDRIEVIPNPSARFEAEGSAGIINIVLKRDASLGLSGNAFLNGGTQGNIGSGANVTFQEGRLTLMGGGFFRLSQRDNRNLDFRQNLAAQPVTFLLQDGWDERLGSSASANLTADFRLSEESSIWGEVQGFRRGNEGDGRTAYTHLDADSVPTQRYDRASTAEQVGLNGQVVAGFRHVLDAQRHEFEAEIQYQRGDDADQSFIRRFFFTPEGEEMGIPAELTIEDENEAEREIGLEMDYIRPVGEMGQVELGYRGDFEETESDRLLEIFAAEGALSPISSADNGFTHRETFHSGYLTLMQTLGPLGVQLGARAEMADSRFVIPSGEQFDKDYFSIFPSGNIRLDAGGGRELRFSYSKRIRRPRQSILNPTNTSNDPLNRRVGNPEIDPAYTHNLSLDASWSGLIGTLRLSPFYRRTVDDWAEIKTVDAAGVSTVTWENLASVANYGASVSANIRRVGPISGFVSMSGYKEERDAANLSLAYSGSSFQWSARSSLQARLSDNTNVQGMLFYRPAREVPQGRFGSMAMMQFGLRQQLMDDRVSLNLNVRDPFNVAKFNFTTRDATHVQTGRTTPSMRSLVLSLSYRFGRPPENVRQRGEGMEEAPEVEVDQGIR